MRELSLFTGAGGGVLGTHLLGWETIGYVEWDKYCQQVIAARIADGFLSRAPIFGDVRQFLLSGAAAEYRGFADVVTAGFPCQPFSLAGKRAGADDSRNMWPATAEVIRAVGPAFAFLENVPGLLSSGYFPTILSDLHGMGYDCRWGVVSAAAVGAPHLRKRLWIVAANANSAERWRNGAQRQEDQRDSHSARHGEPGDVAHATMARDGRPAQGDEAGQRLGQSGDRRPSPNLPDRQLFGLEGEQQAGTAPWPAHRSGDGRHTGWWEVEPAICRVVDGFPNRVAQLRAAGNAQVPAVAAAAWHLLSGTG